jgi:serine/threonine protein kinase/Flp pilus assembly protein TadD
MKAASIDSVNPVLEDLLEEIASRIQAGEPLDIETFAAAHPEHADLLRRVLPTMGALADLARHSGEADASALAAGELPRNSLGDFRILGEVGRGGMGIVYEAEQLSLGRRVALKVLPFAATMDSRHLHRFKNEAHAAAQLHHTNIVPVYYVGCERGVHFYAMQYIEGHSLAEVIAELRRQTEDATTKPQPSPSPPIDAATVGAPAGQVIPYSASSADRKTKPNAALSTVRSSTDAAYFRTVAELGIQAAEALDFAHEHGVIHRDVKPANLLLESSPLAPLGRGTGGEGLRLWVTDFGLAQVHGDARMTMTGDLVGTLRYMSPEQALAKRVVVDHRTDVYSLGATLYELLTLEAAFGGTDRQELLRQIAFEDPKPLRRINRSIPAELEVIVMKAMEKNPADRYATAKEMGEDLQRHLDGHLIKARRPNSLQRANKWARRHRALVWSSVSVLALAGLIAGVGFGWIAGDRAARRFETKKAVTRALEESNVWQQKRKISEALSAAKRAVGLALSGESDQALRQEASARVQDLQLLEDFDYERIRYTGVNGNGGMQFDRFYVRIFRRVFLEENELSPEDAGAVIRQTTIPVELAAALDLLAVHTRMGQGDNDHKSRYLIRVARVADPDEGRDRLRRALLHRDKQALLELARSDSVFNLSPYSLSALAWALCDAGDNESALKVLQGAQSTYPDDYGINHELAGTLLALRPERPADAIPYLMAAWALRPELSSAREVITRLLVKRGELESALMTFGGTYQQWPNEASLASELGIQLLGYGERDSAIALFRRASTLTNNYQPHANLGIVLCEKGDFDAGIAEFRQAIRLIRENPHTARVTDPLPSSRGMQLPSPPVGASGKPLTLRSEGLEVDASSDPRFLLTRDEARIHSKLGKALSATGEPDAAISEYRNAIQLWDEDPQTRFELGLLLKQKCQFREAIACFRRATGYIPATYFRSIPHREDRFTTLRSYEHLLGTIIQKCERLVEIDDKLKGILRGATQPADLSECLELARLCALYKKLNVTAVRFFRDAFAKQPELASDLNTQDRYNAACAAALAGCGQGKDTDQTDEKERARLRRQALDWLQADLAAYRKALDKEPDKAGAEIDKRMQHWKQDKDFALLRDSKALVKLPDAERQEWQKLWAEVDQLRKEATKPAK